MTTMTPPDHHDQAHQVVLGVDTHRDTHTAVALDHTGRQLAAQTFPADPGGYRGLLEWAQSFGPVQRVGVEGTGAYGAGLTRYLTSQRIPVVEIDRPNRQQRRKRGKSDPIDAEAAARAALSGAQAGLPKDRDGATEALRCLRVARRSAVDHRADCIRRIKSLLVTAPDHLRQQLRHLPTGKLTATCAALRPDRTRLADPEQATKLALHHLARRIQQLTTQIDDLDAAIAPLVADLAPQLLALPGVGPDVATQMLITAGHNTTRLRSEAAFAMLCGAAPIPASSGTTQRHRLNRGGDRQANRALHHVALNRMRYHQPTRDYVQRRTTQGLTKREIIRCLKRLIARDIYRALPTTHHGLDNP